MKHSLKTYLNETDTFIKNPKETEVIAYKRKHLLQISFYQHERLIHLLVTFMVALLMTIVLLYTLFNPNIGTFLLFVSLFCLLVPYLIHYYDLENGVQKMYKQYWLLEKISLQIEKK